MDVKINDVKYRVSVCKTHEDGADLGKIRELVSKKIDDFKKFQEIAASLGYQLTPTAVSAPTSGLIVPTPLPPGAVPPQVAPQPVRAPAPVPSAPPVNQATLPQVEVQKGVTMAAQKLRPVGEEQVRLEVLAEEKRRLEKLAEIEAKSAANFARPSTGDAPRYASHSLPEQVKLKDGTIGHKPQTFQTVKQVVRGRAGTPTAIPTAVDSSAGRTIINVKPTDERALEKKWKYEAQMSKGIQDGFAGSLQGSAIPREGYFESAECLMCSGSGKAKIGDGPCARCDGTGYRMT
jgi:hypothetical protein